MAKGQHLSKHQEGIVRRYYEHLDTRTLQQLQEAVSDLYLADPKGAEKLWKKVAGLLGRAGADEPRAQRALESRDVKLLAVLVGELAAPRPSGPPRGRAPGGG